MKRTLFQLVNLLMVCVVLLSSTGFGLVEHSCQMRGKRTTMVVAFSDAKTQPGCSADGKPMPSEQIVRKTDCCQNESSYQNVDSQSSLSQLIAKFVKTVTEAVLAGVMVVIAYLAEWIFDQQSSALSVVDSPPSPSGRDILTLVRSLLL
ncbi:HYC_CC_PP family protein [Spirosoma arcticum]